MKELAFLAFALTALISCKGKSKDVDREPRPMNRNTPTAATNEAPKERPAVLTASAAEGRCTNETPDTPYDEIFFFPSKGELFMPTRDRSVFRLPIRVRAESGPNVEFQYKWSEDESRTGSDHPAAATLREGGKLSFRFETLKPTLCERSDYEDFYFPLTRLEVAAGRYVNDEHGDTIEVREGAQKLVSEEGGKVAIAHYRVKSHSAQAIELYVSSAAPRDSRPEVWVEWTLSVAGDVLTVDYMGKFTRSYRRQ